eukprot:8121373-Pyramimonas_sp.AAC.1
MLFLHIVRLKPTCPAHHNHLPLGSLVIFLRHCPLDVFGTLSSCDFESDPAVAFQARSNHALSDAYGHADRSTATEHHCFPLVLMLNIA